MIEGMWKRCDADLDGVFPTLHSAQRFHAGASVIERYVGHAMNSSKDEMKLREMAMARIVSFYAQRTDVSEMEIAKS